MQRANLRFVLTVAAMLFAAGSVVPLYAVGNGDRERAGAAEFVQGLGVQVLNTMQDKLLGLDQKRAKLESLFLTSVDMDWVARFAMGRHWKSANDTQRQLYLQAYRSFVAKHYTSKFSDYAGQRFAITKAETDAQGNYLIGMTILAAHAGEPDIALAYRVRQMPTGEYKVFDVIVEGVSLITTQRTEFSSIIEQKGVDYLIAQLARKTMEASAASPGKAG